MLAAFVSTPAPKDPLSVLEVGERPEPEVPENWTTVQVKAVSLNHHDLFSLQGIGLPQERMPMILGTDAAGLDEDGNEVVVHGVVATPGWTGDETLDPKRSLFSELHQGTMAERVAVPRRNVVPKPAELSFAEAACLPTAWLTAYRVLFVRSGLRPGSTILVQGASGGGATALIRLAHAGGCPGRGGDRADPARQRGGLPGVGDRPQRGEAHRGARARRRPGVRDRRPAARAG